MVATTAVACSSTNSTYDDDDVGERRVAPIGQPDDSRQRLQRPHRHHRHHASDVGNVSTLAIGGLFKGALVGTQAYADYVNSTGGVNGRKIVVDSADDGYTGTGNKTGHPERRQHRRRPGRRLLHLRQLRRDRSWPRTRAFPT